jgi:hypothetical protein
VVRPGRNDDALVPGVVPGHPHGEIVGFRTRAREHDVPEFDRHRAQELLAVAKDRLLDVPGVGVQRRELSVYGLDDVGVAVPDAGDVVVDVEVVVAVGVVEQCARAAHDFDRLLVEESISGPEETFPFADLLTCSRGQPVDV